jgi:glycerophosphoryl diester phosphodiesterase
MMPVQLPRIIGHRGAAHYAPENTLAGIRKAKRLGIDWVEVDVRLSKDGVPMLMHDYELNRTAGLNATIDSMTAEELEKLDAGTWFNGAYAGEPVPTLAETLLLIISLDMAVNLEIKADPKRPGLTARALIETVNTLWPVDRPLLVSSFDVPELDKIRQLAPHIPRGLLVEKIGYSTRSVLDAVGCATLNCHHSGLTADSVTKMTDAGYPVLAYTVNDPLLAAELYTMGVAGVFSDTPDRLIDAAAA